MTHFQLSGKYQSVVAHLNRIYSTKLQHNSTYPTQPHTIHTSMRHRQIANTLHTFGILGVKKQLIFHGVLQTGALQHSHTALLATLVLAQLVQQGLELSLLWDGPAETRKVSIYDGKSTNILFLQYDQQFLTFASNSSIFFFLAAVEGSLLRFFAVVVSLASESPAGAAFGVFGSAFAFLELLGSALGKMV